MPLPVSVDLFTGLGGFVLGLSHLCTPIVYCDSSVIVQSNLTRLMSLGKIPKATIVSDVRDTDAIVRAVRGRRVGLLTAGFPCTGFSSFGHRDGLENSGSALVQSVFDAVDKIRPHAVMLENSAGVLTVKGGNDMRLIARRFARLGYDFQWTTCRATDVGLPHERLRWFCLCTLIKEPASGRKLPVGIDSPSVRLRPMPSLLSVRTPSYRARYFMLGNAVVPAVVRLAFERLREMDKSQVVRTQSEREPLPRHGFWRAGAAVLVHPRARTRPPGSRSPYCSVPKQL